MNGTGEQESLTDWEEIQSPFLKLQSTEPDRIVCTSNDDLSVFPPNHHEGLQIPSQDVHVPIFNQEEPTPLVPSPEEEADRKPGKVDNGIGKVLSYGISRAVARIRYYVVSRGWGCLLTFRSVAGVVAAILLSLAYVKVRRWRGTAREERQHKLFLLIKEKDQKINQLLLQISQLNQLLYSRRRVPVFRTG
ncbi:hypothetical protein SLE2022_334180 [Rubroshorea leprosula]